MSTPRTYVVGLPVVIEVADDGSVTFAVDTSEAGQAIRESDGMNDATDAQIESDAAAVDALPERDAIAVVRP